MVTRREVLRIAVTGVAALAIGGAAGWYGRESEVASLRKRVEELASRAGIKLEDEIDILNWTWYINLSLLEDWAREHKIKLVYDTFESSDEALAKIKAGSPPYDLAVISDVDVGELAEGGYLREIDVSKIPNFELIPDEFKGLYFDPENKYSVIYSYGTVGLATNTKYTDGEAADEWADIFDVENPDSMIRRYPKKVTLLTTSDDVISHALLYLGLDPNTCEEKDLKKAIDLLLKVKPYLYGLKSTEAYMKELPAGEYYISQSWSGDIAGIIYNSDERKVLMGVAHPEIKYKVPKEGANFWCDNFVMPKTAKHINAAYAFINWFLDPVIAAINTMTIKYPYPTGEKYVPESLRKDPVIFVPKELRKKCFMYTPRSPKCRELWKKYWTIFVSG